MRREQLRRFLPRGATALAVVTAGLTLAGCDPVELGAGQLGVDGVEVTQSVQFPGSAIVPLIAYKETYVRVYARVGGQRAAAGVGATLTVGGATQGGVPIATRTLQPVNGATRTVGTSVADPSRIDTTFVFKLDPVQIQTGARTITAKLTYPTGWSVPPGGGEHLTKTIDVAFGPLHASDHNVLVSRRIYPLRYKYRNVPAGLQTQDGLAGATYPARSRDDVERQRLGAQNVLPLAALTTDWSFEDRIGVPTFDCKAVTASNGRISCGGFEDARIWAAQKFDEVFPGGNQWLVVIQPENPTGFFGAQTTTGKNNVRINAQLEPANEEGLTLAHEIGHALGLGHTPDLRDFADPNYPRADGSMGVWAGLRTTPALRVIPGVDAAGRPTAYDLMSYRSPHWISAYSYCKAMDALTQHRQTCPPGLDGWDA
jgi:hypothetical protein